MPLIAPPSRMICLIPRRTAARTAFRSLFAAIDRPGPSIARTYRVVRDYRFPHVRNYLHKRMRAISSHMRMRAIFNLTRDYILNVARNINPRLQPPSVATSTTRRWYVPSHSRRPAQVRRATRLIPLLLSYTAHSDAARIPLGANNPAKFDTDSVRVAIDNCASRCITNDERDFLPGTTTQSTSNIQGLGTIRSTKTGTVRWTIADDAGLPHVFDIPNVLLVPTLPFRLLSPQHWAQTQPRSSAQCITTDSAVYITWDHDAHRRTAPLAPNTNVGFITTVPGYANYKAFLATHQALPVPSGPVCFPATTPDPAPNYVTDDDTDQESDDGATITTSNTSRIDFGETDVVQPDGYPEKPISDAQQELLRWHLRLGHASFDKLRIMASEGAIPKRLRDCPVPVCPACVYGKMTKRPWRTRHGHTGIEPVPITKPGDCVSVDQMHSPTPGFYGLMKGHPTRKRYNYATVFVDQYSKLSYVHMQVEQNSIETVEGKKAFEKFARRHGVTIRHYHADNGRFADNLFMADVARTGQTISFCGVNAHFQNGIAERRIRELQESTRTILLDAKSRWPTAISANLWPYAMRYANQCHQHLPIRRGSRTGKTPLHLFTSHELMSVRCNLQNTHPFGCPVYCLDNALQGDKYHQKWMPRARLGIHLGPAPNHASTVAMVLNPTTACVSPQYHTKFDDLFETTEYPRNKVIDCAEWQRKSGFKCRRKGRTTFAVPKARERTSQNYAARPRREHSETSPSPREPDERPDDLGPAENDYTTPGITITRSGRRSVPPERYIAEPAQRDQTAARDSINVQEDNLETQASHFPIAFEALAEHGIWDQEDDQRACDPIAYLAKSGDPDTMYIDEALRAPDRAEFIQAMSKEVHDHISRKHFILVPRRSIPVGTKILPAVWSCKRKRRVATGEVYKHKARLNVGGHKQERYVHFWETFAPVVNWFTIRLFLVIALLQGWYTRQYDFVLAYPQADVMVPLFMEVPRGFTLDIPDANNKDYCLELKKNIYGSRNAGRIWTKYIDKGLRDIGFVPSQVDECLYYRGSTIFMLYVDDAICIDASMDKVHQVYKDILSAGYDISDEGDLKDYLGVDVDRQPDGSIHMSQPKLIEQILQDMNFQPDTKGKSNPATVGSVLHKNAHEEPHKADWNYRSIIGKLNFLEKSTRPDIAFATHNAARFSADPRESHSSAVTHLCRYLLNTRDQGMYYRPDMRRSFEVHVDAEFGGLFNRETAADDPDTARSRGGYIVRYANCPIIWSSRLITEICLSTTEAEYVALSESMRATIPIMNLMHECQSHGILDQAAQPNVYCTAFEDNNGALELARAPKMRPRTKHINQKYHFFRSQVARPGDNEGRIHILAIDTREQLGDIFTKAVSNDLFLKFRKAIMGW